MSEVSRRTFLAGASAGAAAAQAARRPNVLLIMTDTHRADAIGAWGNTAIRTPHLDRLAAGGVRFTNCWSQHPVCMPARATIFTGRYPSSHGVRSNGIRLAAHELTLAEHLRRNGYSTFGAGKFHFIPHFRGQLPVMESHRGPYYGFEEFHLGEDGRRGEQALWIQREHPQWAGKPDRAIPLELHNSTWIADHTSNFFKRAAKADRPFFAFASFVDPHQPYDPPPPYAEMYKEAAMARPLVRAGEHDRRPPQIARFAEGYRALNERVMHHRTQSYGEVSLIDDSIGRILATLDETGLRSNTAIVFLSDHGDMLGDHSLFYKGPYHFHQCARVPLLVQAPGVSKAGKVVDGIVQQTDIFPTVTSLCGLDNPPGVQGRSLREMLGEGGTAKGYESALIEYGISGASAPEAQKLDGQPVDLWTLRTAEWRLSHYPGTSHGELYELSTDPEEFVNVWADAKYRDIRTKLREQLLDRVLAAHDPLPLREQPY